MNQYIDDLLVFDGNGGVNNDIPSTNWFVTCELPKTDAVSAGANAGLTPSTGSDHGALVDENPPSTSDYNGHATAGNKDTYKFAAPSTGGGTIIGVQVNIYALKSDAGAKTACPVVRHSGSDYDGTTFTLLTTAKYFTQVYETNPGTGSAWVAANVTEFGMKVVS
jgi:hypothetical protein